MSSKSALSKALARQLADSLLPGDPCFSPEGLDQAAAFVLAGAASREPGQASIVIESISGSASDRFMRIALINDDMPFLVDSISATIAAHGLGIDRLLHPVMAVKRDSAGHLAEVLDPHTPGEKRESMIYLETERGDARVRRALETALAATLADVKMAVADWPRLQEAMGRDADQLGGGEGAALLRWFKDGMLTQLGHVTRMRDGSQSDALGICKKSAKQVLAPASFDRAFA